MPYKCDNCSITVLKYTDDPAKCAYGIEGWYDLHNDDDDEDIEGCCNCAKSRGWSSYKKHGCGHCKARADPAKAERRSSNAPSRQPTDNVENGSGHLRQVQECQRLHKRPMFPSRISAWSSAGGVHNMEGQYVFTRNNSEALEALEAHGPRKRPRRQAAIGAIEKIHDVLNWEGCKENSEMFKLVKERINQEFERDRPLEVEEEEEGMVS